MQLKLTRSLAEFRRLKELYTEAFPPAERAPWPRLVVLARQNRAQCWTIEEQGQPVGLAYVLTHEELAYLFYFAIDKEYRGEGLGTRALGLLLERCRGKRFFLALEDWTEDCDNREQRLKRRDFYQRCGLHQLPYKLKEVSVIYAIMGSGGAVEPEEYAALIARFLGPLKHFLDMRILKE